MCFSLVAALLFGASRPGFAAAAVPTGEAVAALAIGWQPTIAGRRQLTAVALDAHSGRVALGDARGVVLLSSEGTPLESLSQPDVTSLAFGPDGILAVGTSRGLFVREALGDLVDRTPSPGEDGRSITRLAACGPFLVVASGGGVHVSRDGRTWQTIPGALARTAALAVAVRCAGAEADLLAVAGGDVWETRLRVAGSALEMSAALPIPGLEAGVRARSLDVALGAGGEALVLTAELLATRAVGEDFSVRRPVLAPGAQLQRAAFATGTRWLATDRGLFAQAVDGAWTRLPAGGALSSIRDLGGDATRIVAATDDGLLAGDRHTRVPGAGALRAAREALESPPPSEPPVDDVFRASLAYLSLRPEELKYLRRGLALRGFLPSLEFDLQRGRGVDFDSNYDEAFTSGDVRRLRDRHSGSAREVSATVSLSWELGDLAFSPDAIDLSREARAVIQLRDDVLDEITHLYFERRRVLLELAAVSATPDRRDVDRLRLRADELAAGLDAWTGGWFGRQVPALAR